MARDSKARSARWRDRRRNDALLVKVAVLPKHRRALEAMGLIAPGHDRNPQAISCAVSRYLDTAPAMHAFGDALYPDWPEETDDDMALPGCSGENEG
jgi:hypothetical protein